MSMEHRTMAAFILSELVNGNPTGQEACLQRNIISICLDQLDNGLVMAAPRLRQWVAICLGEHNCKFLLFIYHSGPFDKTAEYLNFCTCFLKITNGFS